MCQADLPLEMLPALLELGRALQVHARAHPDAPLDVQEQGVLDAWRRLAPRFLEAVLRRATSGLDPQARAARARCPRCQQRQPVHARRTRQVQTRLGPIRLERPWHHCGACGHGWSPSDQALGLVPHQQTSAGLARWEAQLGAVTTFREATTLLADLAGVDVGIETLRTHAEQVGTELEGQQRAAMAHVAAQHESPAGEHDPAPGTLVVETDGVMVRYRDRHLDGTAIEGDWHEVKLGVVGGWADGGADAGGHLRAPSYVAAREPAAAFARRLGLEAARRGALDVVAWHPWDGTPAELRPVVVLGDGAPWIWEHIGPLFGPERTEVVDYFHLTEHVWTAAKALGGEGDATTAWVHTALDALWQHGPSALVHTFEATPAPTALAREVLRRERGYVRRNAPRMDYPALRRRGLPIGSGAVESGAKHLVQQRLKRAGMRWGDLGARAILDLRCHLLTGRSLAAVPTSPTKLG
jgi:hypothetical protein